MSPASKTKGKYRPSAKSAKDHQKAYIKPAGTTNTVSGSPASGYNPLSGMFHTLEIPSAASSPPFHDNGRFRNIDESDEHNGSPRGLQPEYDAVSNNNSCSGDSEDLKEKITTSRQETVPGLDNDRREKIRLKNEKKHQRQRERRAQELHERCCGYLMSRKLEALSQQLVTMGFSPEQATLALMLNEGRLEESVNWLFEGNEEEAQNKDTTFESGSNLKIDISDELARISEIELKYKCSKQEVERAVVACEGDLIKAEETLHAHKQEQPPTPPAEETADVKIMRRPQETPTTAASVTIQDRRNERDFNYIKTAVTMPTYPEPGSRNLQRINQTKSLAEKRFVMTGSSPSFSSPMAPPLQSVSSQPKLDVRLGVAVNEGKHIQQIVREPVVMTQLSQSVNAKQNPVPSMSASPSVTSGWYPSNVPGVDNVRSGGKNLSNQVVKGPGVLNQSSEQFYHPSSYKETPFLFGSPLDSTSTGLGGARSSMVKSTPLAVPSEPHGPPGSVGASSPSLAVPSSLGLFTGWGSAGALSSSHVDWNTGGLMPEFDYTSIDWTLDSNMLSSKSNNLWLGLSSLLSSTSGTGMSRTNTSRLSALRDNGVPKETSSSAGSHEWTSPFAGKDIFSLPRQFVTSPFP